MPDEDFLTVTITADQAFALGYLIMRATLANVIPEDLRGDILSFSETVSMEILRQKSNLFD